MIYILDSHNGLVRFPNTFTTERLFVQLGNLTTNGNDLSLGRGVSWYKATLIQSDAPSKVCFMPRSTNVHES